MDRIELLAPAGDMERLKVTLLYGADAVYIGGYKYGLRANAINFSKEQIKEACVFAHRLNKKVYLTLNMVFHNEDIDGVYEYIDEVVKCGIDAFIISDPFLISYIKEKYKSVEVHLSTQNSTTNYEIVNYFKGKGVDRVVLARELSREEIKEIIDKTHVDTEIFIHGAMCTFYSGRCCLSNYVTNRDSNRGGCAQVCRFAFAMEGEKDLFTFATNDLNLARYIKDIIDIGVKSIKVEGRMRTIYYLATIIGSYRKLIDAYYDGKLTDELLQEQVRIVNRVANRKTSSHHFSHQANETDQYFTGRSEASNQDYLALIIGYDEKNKMLIMKERNYFKKGDEVEIFTPTLETYSFTVDEIYDDKDQSLEVARHPEQILKIKFDKPLPEYSMMRIKTKEEV